MPRLPPRLLAAVASLLLGAAAPDVTPTSVLAAAPAKDWTSIDPRDLLVIDLASGGRVVILLGDSFAPIHAGKIRALARAHWYDGLAVDRVQDNYVTQWGDADGKKPLPASITARSAPEYDRPAAGLHAVWLPYPDSYAERAGAAAGFPVAEAGGRVWPVHCYGMVGVGRDLNPDNGDGAELYAVIGQAPRALDRNLTVVGRVIDGMEHLAALPRGTGPLGFYVRAAQRVPIARVRLATDLPPAQRPPFQLLNIDSASYTAWLHVRANRQDSFYLRPAAALDVCNALPPVRTPPPP